MSDFFTDGLGLPFEGHLKGAGTCSNGAEQIAELRRRGLGDEHLRYDRIRFIDRDGYPCRPGMYSLTAKGHRATYTWLAKCRKGFSGKRS